MLVVILLCYALAGSFGLWFDSLDGAVTPLWAPTGIAIAAMLFFGYRVWPAIVFGSVITGLVASGSSSSIFVGVLASVTEAFLATYLINKYAHGEKVFEKVVTTLYFIVFSGILSTVLGATIGAYGLVLFGRIPWQSFFLFG